jgi:hypothetical protein
MVEYWNDGMASFGQINACGEKKKKRKLRNKRIKPQIEADNASLKF